MKKTLLAIAIASTLVGCGRIETGYVGVRTDFNKTVETQSVPPGFYAAVLTSVDTFVDKEIEVALNDMKPKAKDNLSLEDLDVSVFYKPNPAMVPALVIKYAGMSPKVDGHYFPSFTLIERYARSSTYDAVSQYDSLTIHTKRNELEKAIKERVQGDADASDKGAFIITKVIVRQMMTDKTLEASIQQSVRVQKETEAKQGQIALAKAEAERINVEAAGQASANRKIAESITPQLVELRRIEMMQHFSGQGTHTVLLPATGASALVNVGK